LEKESDAANQIIRITSGLSDVFGGVFLERAATLFGQSKMFRRQAFHSVLAGHRYERTDLMKLAFQCYSKALPHYMDRGWTNAEDNVLCVVSRDPNLQIEDRIECAQRLVRGDCISQSEEQQLVFLRNYLRQIKELPFVLPIVSREVDTFYGYYPAALSAEDLNKKEFSPIPDCSDFVADPTWPDIERASFHLLAGLSASFHPNSTFANGSTNNSTIRSISANERFTVRLRLTNPLKILLKLRRLRLGFDEVCYHYLSTQQSF
jgi:hypothetical protein